MQQQNIPTIDARLDGAANLIEKMNPLLEMMRKANDKDYESIRTLYARLDKTISIVATVCSANKRSTPANLITEDSMKRVSKMLESDYKKCKDAFDIYSNKYIVKIKQQSG
jgi:methanogenic corrinoid protein MtbC1